jgi:hypothetical protein
MVKSCVFGLCSNLATVSLPKVIVVESGAFSGCKNLTSINLPNVTTISSNAFRSCYSLATVSLPKTIVIGSSAFYQCFNLKSLYLMASQVCTLSNSSVFYSTPIGGYSTSAGTYGSIYVPASLLTSYKAATNWAYFSNRMVGI